MIDIKDVKKMIERIVEPAELEKVNVSLYLLEDKGTKNNPITVYLLNIGNDVIDQIRDIGKKYLVNVDNIAKENDFTNIPLYNPDSDQELFRIDSNEVESFAAVLKYLNNEQPCAVYKKGDVKENKLKSWVIRFELIKDGQIEQLLFFQKFQPAKMLSQKLLTIFEDNKAFKMIKGNVLNLKYAMDFLYYKGAFIVSNMPAFERTFGFHDYYKKSAVDLITALTRKKVKGHDCKITFTDLDAVNSRIDSNTRLAHKLFSADRNNYYKKIRYNKLVALNKKYNFNLELDDSKKEWLVDDKTDLQVVARVLNDEYEISLITDIEYIVDSKEVAEKP